MLLPRAVEMAERGCTLLCLLTATRGARGHHLRPWAALLAVVVVFRHRLRRVIGIDEETLRKFRTDAESRFVHHPLNTFGIIAMLLSVAPFQNATGSREATSSRLKAWLRYMPLHVVVWMYPGKLFPFLYSFYRYRLFIPVQRLLNPRSEFRPFDVERLVLLNTIITLMYTLVTNVYVCPVELSTQISLLCLAGASTCEISSLRPILFTVSRHLV